jgi:hypothetical protein
VISGLINRSERECIEGTAHGLQTLEGDVQIAGRGADAGMSEQHLNGAEVGTGVEQVSGAGMAKDVLILLMICTPRRSAIVITRTME